MTVKRIKPSASQRAVKRLQEQIDALGDAKARQRDEFSRYKYECDKILRGFEATEHHLKDVLTNNNVKIVELENQVANQYRENSALRQDLEANSKRNIQHVRDINNLRNVAQHTELELIAALSNLEEARHAISYRVYGWFVARVERAKEGFEIRKQRMINNWKIRRLNKARVAVITEAGYIPQKLVEIAHRYWEADKRRAQEDERIESTVYHPSGDRTDVTINRRPGFLRRLQIYLGRA